MQDPKVFDDVLKTFQTALEKQRTQEGLSSVRPIEEQLFFNYYFNPNKVYKGSQGSLFQMHRKTLNLHDKKIRVSYINPMVSCNQDELSEVLNQLGKRDLITMIYSDRNEMLERLGFEAVVEHQLCNIPSQNIPDFDVKGIILDVSALDMKHVFDIYAKHFTGYFERNIHDFERIRRDTHFLKGKITGFMKGDQMVGYIRSVHHGSYVEVLECCYDTSGTLLRLLSFVSRGANRIIYHTNASERIHKILPNVKIQNKVVMLARVNDKALFERLFHIKIISSYSAFNAFSKPVLNTDIY